MLDRVSRRLKKGQHVFEGELIRRLFIDEGKETSPFLFFSLSFHLKAIICCWAGFKMLITFI